MLRMAGVWTLIFLAQGAVAQGAWSPAEGPLRTRWAQDLDPARVLPEYPRPGLVRDAWLNLNGLWDFALAPRDAGRPAAFGRAILVPFAVESALSGIKEPVGGDRRAWYRRSVEVPAAWAGQRVLLHFGAVDWETTVWVNGQEVGTHRGGYDPFHFDITGALRAGPQEVVVAVWDPTDAGTQPRGKQVNDPNGIWYTAVTGIWQTVWMEPVPEASIASLALETDIDAGALGLRVDGRGLAPGDRVEAVVLDGGAEIARRSGPADTALTVAVPNAKLWSPDAPFLYDLVVTLRRGDAVADTVRSYFGMRKIAVAKDAGGVNRLFLNDAPLFQFGPLDQGWWPDGLYTAPTDAALAHDVEVTRAMGFNMARKHVKVEPARWYYHCDRLGLLVWQDMPNGDARIHRDQPDITRSPESDAQYRAEWEGIINALRNHPSIVMWVPFNEGWGQYETAAITDWTRRLDPTRLVNSASGWTDRGTGDVNDIHVYPGPAMPPVEERRAAVLGEFGGLGLPVAGHLWQGDRNWGYRTYASEEEFRRNYAQAILRLRPLIGSGLAAAVYTQTTDVEGEVNGLLTYDRAKFKLPVAEIAAINAQVFLPPPVLETFVPTSEAGGVLWRYTFEKPKGDWRRPTYDDSAWREGPGVLGTEGTPGAAVRTTWDTEAVWCRRVVEIDRIPEGQLCVLLHHDEDATVYINGKVAAEAKGFSETYTTVVMLDPGREALKVGRNVIAVHCRQTGGGQCIDVGLAVVRERGDK
jgi:hypothetical protein